MKNDFIYFDNAATTYPKPKIVYEALQYANEHHAFNSGRGQYRLAHATLSKINLAREQVASLVNAKSNDVVFLSSATEALNMIINGLELSEGDVVYVSPFEHNAILRPLYALQKRSNIVIEVIEFDKLNWQVDLNKLANQFALKRPAAIFLSHISNVTGFELPYQEIFKLSTVYGGINILDCAQSLGIYNPIINDVNYLVFAGHKSLYGIQGVGGFIVCGNNQLTLSKFGGTGSDTLTRDMPVMTPNRYEAGTLNAPAIITLIESINYLKNNAVAEHEEALMKYLIDKLKALENIEIYRPVNYLPKGILSISMKGYTADEVARILDQEFNIGVRSGFHCAPLIHDFINTKDIQGTVRISLNFANTIAQIDQLISAINSLSE